MATPGPIEHAVSNFVDGGIYPEDNAILTADLPSATLQSLGKLLDRARSDVKTSIRELSRLSAPDIDGWISQAKQLKSDIDSSVAQSEEISHRAGENAKLQEQTADAAGKVRLLQGEVTFNQTLVDTLSSIRELKSTVESSSDSVTNDAIPEAVSGLARARLQLEALGTFQTTTVAQILSDNVAGVEQKLRDSLDAHWDSLVEVNTDRTSITVGKQSGKSTFSDVASALADLDLLKPKVLILWRALDTMIIGPRLTKPSGKPSTIQVQGGTLSLGGASTSSVEALFADIDTLRTFLETHLPAVVSSELSSLMMPSLMSRLTSGPLPASVPADLGGIPIFNETLKHVTAFAQKLQSSGWKGTDELTAWVANAPQVWLQGRKADSLNSMRLLLKRGLGNPRSVERVETQTIIESDEVFGNAGGDDDWDTAWDEDEEPASATAELAAARHAAPAAPAADQGTAPAAEDDEDGGAWGWDDDGEQRAEEPAPDANAVEEDEGEAWGWGDDERPEVPVHETVPEPQRAAPSTRPAHSNGTQRRTIPAERTVTLRESYHITALPESILELIIMVVDDADSLSRAQDNPVAAATSGLYELAALLLAMYRANAPDAYSVHESGNMFLYNDCQYLAEQLQSYADHHASRSSAEILKLDDDIKALALFGKRAYSKEMDSQRTILGDLLDGAQGFASCSEQPYASQCDLAVTSVIDRISQVNAQWKSVLSPSALLQSTGSLLSTVISKIILDVEDMSDIQESESKALTSYCSSIESLENLFLPQQETQQEGEAPVPLTAGYVPSWLKFQYLSNILDSSLVDIKYLWTEGSLSLEFTADEVVDLIEALFAESPRRREAIGEIRRSAR